MERALGEMKRRRTKQEAYNKKNNISPTTVIRAVQELEEFQYKAREKGLMSAYSRELLNIKDRKGLSNALQDLEKQMRAAADVLDFELAALLRDRIKDLKQMEVKGKS